ncbi:DUF4911 domain-containing protein [Desulfoprunum benzoelyticum]|uniref:DUF4911 domain-containing protein n=1 Tax=Desulfoprunum benzoelyticum TaxID=1506996 RepID=A0A840UJJ2_9BACT|nr:hypothetical protein [Desulfoprunum benzoelyticum]MBM9528964.1 DUF4911 domain-containing protein [Desulfoprunum benzoelyticum]
MKPNLNTLDQLFLRISEEKFHYLKSILEGYDNFGVLTSCPEKHGVVVLRFSPGLKKEILELLGSLSEVLKKH